MPLARVWCAYRPPLSKAMPLQLALTCLLRQPATSRPTPWPPLPLLPVASPKQRPLPGFESSLERRPESSRRPACTAHCTDTRRNHHSPLPLSGALRRLPRRTIRHLKEVYLQGEIQSQAEGRSIIISSALTLRVQQRS